MMDGYNYHVYRTASAHQKVNCHSYSTVFVLTLDNGKERFVKEVTELSKAFALYKSMEEVEVNAQGIIFFRCESAARQVYEG